MWDVGAQSLNATESQATEEPTLFNRLLSETAGMTNCTQIRAHIERYFGLQPGELQRTDTREWRISHPRQIAVAICYTRFRGRMSYQAVADQFGRLHYSTAIHACRKHGMVADPALSERGRFARAHRGDVIKARKFACAA